MIRLIIFIALMLLPGAAHAQCSQADSNCNSKLIMNPIIGPPQTGDSNGKLLSSVVINTANAAAAKLAINVVVIPGAAITGIVPASPMTHFR